MYKKGYLEGKVIINFQFGDKYVGEYKESYFDNGLCNRHGKKIYPDGRIYIGEFQNDIENGKGILIKGDKRICGIWKNS
jgi:hypothetical protein